MATWWQQGVVYQIYPRSFMDSNGDGVGDLAGIIHRLDYLVELGVDVLWISPIYPSPMADFGYDVSDYRDIHPLFGDMATFDRLLAAAHQRGLKVVLDYVPNHSSDQHPWFVAARSSRDNPKRDWYIWKDAKPDGSPPNNWVAFFGGSQWEWDAGTGQYYLHSFLPEQPDLNWQNPELEAAMLDVLRFWLDKGVDGFRMDVLFCTLKHPDFPDNPPAQSSIGKSMGEFDTQDHIYDFDWGERRQYFVSTLRQLFESYGERVIIGETYFLDPAKLVPYYGENVTDGIHIPFNFTFMHLPWRAAAFKQAIERYYGVLPAGATPSLVLGSHDEHRMASRFGVQNARSAGLLLLTLRGTPTMYYGDEIGMQDVPIPPEKEQDPHGLRVPGLGLGRDPERTPMQWDASPNAGFAPSGVETWLPIAADYAQVNVAAERGDPTSTLSFYKTLLALRRDSAALLEGDFAFFGGGPEDVLAYTRTAGAERLLVVVNFGATAQTLALPGGGVGELLLSTRMTAVGTKVDLAGVQLAAHEGLLVRLG